MIVTVSILTPIPFLFFFNAPAPTEIYTLSLHDALPISAGCRAADRSPRSARAASGTRRSGCTPWSEGRSEEHTSELQSRRDLVCRLLLEKKKRVIFAESMKNPTIAPDGLTSRTSDEIEL